MDLKLKHIRFQNVSYTVTKGKTKKTILNDVSGEFKSGQLTAIMGPSGAGKSTLLDILTGFIRNGVEGSIHMDDVPLGHPEYLKKCSYISRDDNLYPYFTVHETMMLAADLKIADVSIDERNLTIDNVLNTLQLIPSKNTKCGRLSGGERKRLSIALELLDNRSVFFLDEATSGLDSFTSAKCIRLLQSLSREGSTIICTIHQPSASIFEMFDQVYVLAQGQCVYRGSPGNILSYLADNGLQCPMYHNLADFVVEVVNGEHGDCIPQLAISANRLLRIETENSANSYVEDQDESVTKLDSIGCPNESLLWTPTGKDINKSPSEWSKFWTLTRRFRTHFYRDWTITHIKLITHIVCAILIGLLYGDSGTNAYKSIANIGFLLLNLTNIWYITIMPSVVKFPTEMEIVRKETFNHWYTVRTYFLATTLVTTPIHILFATIYSAIIFYMTDQPCELNRFIRFTLVYILITIGADGMGLLLGSFTNAVNGIFLAAVITAFKLAFSGFAALYPHMMPVMRLFCYLSTFSFSLEALVLSVYDGNRGTLECPDDMVYCHYSNPKKLIREIGMNANNYDLDVSVVIIHLLLLKTLAYFMLKRRLKTTFKL